MGSWHRAWMLFRTMRCFVTRMFFKVFALEGHTAVTSAPLKFFWNQIPSTQMASSLVFCSELSEAY